MKREGLPRGEKGMAAGGGGAERLTGAWMGFPNAGRGARVQNGDGREDPGQQQPGESSRTPDNEDGKRRKLFLAKRVKNGVDGKRRVGENEGDVRDGRQEIGEQERAQGHFVFCFFAEEVGSGNLRNFTRVDTAQGRAAGRASAVDSFRQSQGLRNPRDGGALFHGSRRASGNRKGHEERTMSMGQPRWGNGMAAGAATGGACAEGEREKCGGGRRNGRGKTLTETTRRGTTLGTREEEEMRRTGLTRWTKGMAVALVAGVWLAVVAWGAEIREEPQAAEGDTVATQGGEAWRVEMKAEVGAQLLELVEKVSQLRRDSMADANPVLVAYEQLSREMERWFKIFAALGTVLGLLVPLFSYCLQIKAVDQHEAHVEKLIQKSIGDAQNEVAKLIDIKVRASEMEIDETIKNKLNKFDQQISGLWKQHAIYVQMIINELYQKVVGEWENDRDGVDIGLGLLSFCNLLDECAHSSGDVDELKNAAFLVLRVFHGLWHDKNAPKFWQMFSSKLSARDKSIAYHFHFSKELLGEEDYETWKLLCSLWGIKEQGDNTDESCATGFPNA